MRCLECVTSSAVGTSLLTNDTGDPLELDGMGSVDLSETSSGFRVVNIGKNGVTHVWKTLSEF